MGLASTCAASYAAWRLAAAATSAAAASSTGGCVLAGACMQQQSCVSGVGLGAHGCWQEAFGIGDECSVQQLAFHSADVGCYSC
jgi:hypothetical protein